MTDEILFEALIKYYFGRRLKYTAVYDDYEGVKMVYIFIKKFGDEKIRLFNSKEEKEKQIKYHYDWKDPDCIWLSREDSIVKEIIRNMKLEILLD